MWHVRTWLTHYGYDTRRGKLAMDAIGILPQFKGICIRDGWFSYDEYRQATHALCNVHLLRELVYLKETCARAAAVDRTIS
ncbi:MAG: transposase [Ktedonobacteraceae bacterium]|nr:transposase [Ktedonobacteraceae bacterium]